MSNETVTCPVCWHTVKGAGCDNCGWQRKALSNFRPWHSCDIDIECGACDAGLDLKVSL